MKTLSLPAALVVAAALAATPARAETLTIGTALPPQSLDPHFANIAYNIQTAMHFFDPLVGFDAQMRLIPVLAEAWKPIGDTTWEFKLRKGVKFHDGSPFTADDVVFTFERLLGVPNSPSPMARFSQGKKIVKVDDYTLHVSTEKPSPTVPNDLGPTRVSVVSKKNGAGMTTEDYNKGKPVIGTGPYKFAAWQVGEGVEMVANPDYWGGKPQWDRVVMQGIKSDPSRVAALLSGQVDMIDLVPPVDLPRLKTDPNLAVWSTKAAQALFLNVDSNRDISPFVKNNDGSLMFPNALRNWKVRKALSMAINRQGIVERVMEGLGVPTSQVVPEMAFGFNPDAKPEKFDPDGAKKLLAEAGYPDGFRLVIHGPNDRYVNDQQIIEAIAGMWTRIGIKMDVVPLPAAVYYTRASALKFSITLFSFINENGEAGRELRGLIGTFNRQTGMGAYNRGRYSNVRLDGILTEALTTLDEGKREKLLLEAGEIVHRDVAHIPLHYGVNTWATRKGLVYDARADTRTLAQDVSKAK